MMFHFWGLFGRFCVDVFVWAEAGVLDLMLGTSGIFFAILALKGRLGLMFYFGGFLEGKSESKYATAGQNRMGRFLGKATLAAWGNTRSPQSMSLTCLGRKGLVWLCTQNVLGVLLTSLSVHE